jgi:mono/diheme cytochrome c family protein
MKRILTITAVASNLCLMAPAAADPQADAFNKKCANCHGKDGKGATVMGKRLSVRDLATGEIQAQSDADLGAKVSAGNPQKKMPPFKDKLTAEEIKAVVGYVRSFKR